MQIIILSAAVGMSILTFGVDIFIGGAYEYVALNPNRPELVVFLIILNTALAILSAVVAIKGGINSFRFQSTSLIASVSLLGKISLVI
jgi:hypothetical protein